MSAEVICPNCGTRYQLIEVDRVRFAFKKGLAVVLEFWIRCICPKCRKIDEFPVYRAINLKEWVE